MNIRLIFLCVLVSLVACGGKRNKQPSAQPADTVKQQSEEQPIEKDTIYQATIRRFVHAAIQMTVKLPVDTLNFDTLIFSQVLRDRDSITYYTEDDCRCAQALFYKNAQNKVIFKNCDTIYPYSRYDVVNVSRNDSMYVIRAKLALSENEDTIFIFKVSKTPRIYRIIRSNYDDRETNGYFIFKADSAKFKHIEINCDEYQG